MKSRVLVAGGGVASLEAALALNDLAGDTVHVEIFSPRREFLYRPYSVGEPYGASRVSRYDLGDLAPRCGASFSLGSIRAVDPAAREALTHDGERLPYDYVLVASGAQLLWPLPGAITFWGIADEAEIRRVVRKLQHGELRSVVFTMPAVDSWALPVYELALLADTEVTKAGVEDVTLTVVTPEDAPLQLFGRRASEQVSELLAERGVEVLAGTHPVKYEQGRLSIVPGDHLDVDAVVSLPRLEGRLIGGVPHDENGFVVVDEHSRVRGLDRIYAAGDVTNFPVKQGGIATQQADAAAEAIAAEIGLDVEPRPFDPLLRGVLWTGGEPRYLQGWLGGGHGETSTFDVDPPWPERQGKIVGRYLTPFLNEIDSARRSGVSA
ncbi:MAG TPA: FAD-dependent oxidoreductase [Solirubrobacterales bacterium]|jgi:sulfide:quinone oxidoreductase